MITVVGGTYIENCLEPAWREVYGSGLRAASILAKNTSRKVELHTCVGAQIAQYFKQINLGQSSIEFKEYDRENEISFDYIHPLSIPNITPIPDVLEKKQIEVKQQCILYFGMLEAVPVVEGDHVVYDPQSPVKPIKFSETGSKAKHLAYVLNKKEAELITGETDLEAICAYIHNNENAEIVIVKNGARGAILSVMGKPSEVIPVYETKSVWPIGSGDVFAAMFALEWFNTGDAVGSAIMASKRTAHYCETRTLVKADELPINGLTVRENHFGLVYLAGPFFTFAQRWLINEIRNIILALGIPVFSPLHDVGHGEASEVVHKDLAALERAKILFGVLDGLDSGTLFEVGYAVKKGIPVIGYVQNETTEAVKMLEGTFCVLESDLTTAIYKCLWRMIKYD